MEQDSSGSYDGSGSGSNSATVASRAGEGDFTVGGGLKISDWEAAAILIAALLLLYAGLSRRKKR